MYLICGWVMIACMVGLAAAKVLLPDLAQSLSLTFWADAIALTAFGVAWIVAGKCIPLLVDKNEALRLY